MRLRTLATASPRRLLIALGGLTIASAVAVGSGANFNSTSANPGSLITTGTLVVTDSQLGQAIFHLTGLKPGSTSSGTVDIENGGTIPGAFTLMATNLINTPASPAFSAKLNLQIEDLGDPSCVVSCPAPVSIYSGPLGSMGTLALGTFASGATHRYTFGVTFPDGGPNGADNAYGGSSTTVSYTWTATQ